MDALTLLLLLPIAGAIVILLLPSKHKALIRYTAIASSVVTLGYTISLLGQIDPPFNEIQLAITHPWSDRMGTYFALGVDGLSFPLLLLTALLTLVAILASANIQERIRGYYSLILLLETATLGIFVSQDWALFYVFWELVLIPLFFLIDRYGGHNRQTASLNFVLYTMGGSVFMLLSLLVLFDASEGHSFMFEAMKAGAKTLDTHEQVLIFLGLLIGLGVKMPIFPLHGWLPLAHVEAPSPVSILLSGILLKLGSYGLIRVIDTLPDAALNLQEVLLTIGLIGLVYGGLLAWRESDLKRMIAYSSVSHMGVVMIGIATLNAAGITGAVYQMVAHGLVAGALFMLIGLLYERTQTRDINDYGSLIHITPRFAFLLIIAFVGGIGLPGTAGFIAELHTLVGSYQQWNGLVVLVSLGVVITTAYSIRTVKQLYTGPIKLEMQKVEDLHLLETTAAGLLIIITLLLGLYPAPLLDIIAASTHDLAHHFTTEAL